MYQNFSADISLETQSYQSWSASRHIDGQFLLETLVCDVHWTVLHNGAIACLTTACGAKETSWTLRSWRHFLQDNVTITLLGLRYSAEIGITQDSEILLSRLYLEGSKAKKALAPLMAQSGRYSISQRNTLQTQSKTWRKIALESCAALDAIAVGTNGRLDRIYSQNGKVLKEFLSEVACGDTRRINTWGEINLPTLAQRRRTPRRAVQQTCKLLQAGREISAMIIDVSRGGLGLSVSEPLGQGPIFIEVDGRRPLSAKVVWCHDGRAGLSLAVPLEMNDPIFGSVN